MCLPDDKGETCGKIKECVLCDLFGFMTAKKGKGADIRTSPVKVSPAIGLLPFDENSTVDFLTRRKFKETDEKKGGDIVNVEAGTNVYKCGISVDLVRVGNEEEIGEKGELKIKEIVNADEKTKRIKYVVEALRYLTDYSKQSRLLTDFTPDMICITLQDKYSHRLQKAFEIDRERKLNTQRLKEILDDVGDYSKNIYFGMVSGIVSNEKEVRETLKEAGITVKTPKEAVEDAIAALK
jgi:CRISPR-associated protein Cst2